MAEAVKYKQWLFERSLPYLGRRVLDVGAGVGTMTELVEGRERVVALEPEPAYAEMLRDRYAGSRTVRVLHGDATDPAIVDALAEERLDSAMSYNVFEHIEDDRAAFANVNRALRPGSFFVCLVPAGPAIRGRLDDSLGHHRRYTKPELRSKAREAGFEIVSLEHMNLLGYFAWWANGRLLRSPSLAGGGRAVRLYDSVAIPLVRAVESVWRPPFGQSLFLVARATGPR